MGKMKAVVFAFASVVAFSTTCLLICAQDALATAPEGSAYGDLLARIEALESRSMGNVTAPDIRGVKLGMDIRHRFEIRDMMIRDGQRGTTFGENGGVTDLGDVTRLANGTLQRGAGPGTPLNANQTNVGRVETTDFVLQWARISLDADVSKNVRAYIMLQDARTFGEEGSTIGNLQRTDVQEGYVELRNLGDITSILKNVELRAGRWMAAYGDHRLIGSLPWANQTRAYDGARMRWDNKKGHWIDLFAWQIDEKETGVADGGGVLSTSDSNDDREEVFYGFYSHFTLCDGVVFEPYGLVRARSTEDTQPASAGTLNAFSNRLTTGVGTGEQRYTAGFRMAGSKIPGLGGTDFTIEPAWQFGHTEGLRTIDIGNLARGYNSNVTNDIQAWAIYAGAGYTFQNVMWTPRIGYAYSYASGDSRPGEGAVKTFDHLYPTGHAHNGYMDITAWQNIRDHQIHFSVHPTKKLVLDAKLHFMSMDEVADNLYGVAGGTGYGGGMQIFRQGSDTSIINGATRRVDNTLGQEMDFTFSYNMFKNFNVVGGYSHFWADDWLEDTGSGLDRGADWAYLQTTVQF